MDLMHITKNTNYNNKSSPKSSIAIPSHQGSNSKQQNKKTQPNKNGLG